MVLISHRSQCSGVRNLSERLRTSPLLPTALIFFIVIPAQAQDTDSELALEDDSVVIDEITVTGSRITRKNLISTSPMTQVDAVDLKYQGITRVEDLLNDLPQVFPDQHSGVSNGASGTATVDLRGLGSGRTLTLLNGRRLPSGNPYNESTDVNQIPGMLIERVEVLTGGASATYGSDAVGGVVNFITMKDFEGLQLDYQFSQYQHRNENTIARAALDDAGFDSPAKSANDGDTQNFSVIYGYGDGSRGNISAYASYRHIEALTQSERDYSACTMRSNGCRWVGMWRFRDHTGWHILPTSTSLLANPPPTWDPAVDGPWPGSFNFLVEPGTDQFVPRDGHPGQYYNYAPYNYYQRPDKRSNLRCLRALRIQ